MPVDDIVVLLMADYGVNLYGNYSIIVNPTFAARSRSREGLSARAGQGPAGHDEDPSAAVDSVLKRKRRRQEGTSSSNASRSRCRRTS